MLNENIGLVERIYKCRQVLSEMMGARGYDTLPLDNESIMEVYTYYESRKVSNIGGTALDFALTKGNSEKEEDKAIGMFFVDGKTRAINNVLKEVNQGIKDYGAKTFILITNQDIYERAENEKLSSLQLELEILIGEMESKGYFIQIFTLRSLLFNVTKHIYVPDHQIISDEEYEKLAKKFNITSKLQFKTIRRNDPVAKFIGMKRNDICKIIRNSPSAGTYTSYRRCK
jgi:DNA-directed RNA polymerases I, II, and III subunit RPABC1